uniref:Photosystem II reaction center Psb28 protein n=1 Tax=Aureoumbra lagunensis TaxID=44058 RepID=A0A7S3JT10_9STRA|mmetsp:Transcript_18419/g.23963  ORF Transcript_18419/g.23963 Transcript_18419/m.23963 type:complete len:234 (+) Transcript_18419:85-786(+)
MRDIFSSFFAFILIVGGVGGLCTDRQFSAALVRREKCIVTRKRAETNDVEKNQALARIEFIRGIDERIVPIVSVTRSVNSHKNAQQNEIFFTGTATFWFEKASALNEDLTQDKLITGMFLIDEEGTISTDDIHARFERGRPIGISAVLVLSNPTEWHRFMRFMKRFSQKHGLAFKLASDDTPITNSYYNNVVQHDNNSNLDNTRAREKMTSSSLLENTSSQTSSTISDERRSR